VSLVDDLYLTYAAYLQKKYGTKVYKLPVNLPVSCPHRDESPEGGGCIFCGVKGAAFENLANSLSVTEQIRTNMAFVRRKYKAQKFIAYFQTYTSTYLPVEKFKAFVEEACVQDIVSVAVSTRPDCIQEPYLDVLSALQAKYGVDIDIELGLQTTNEQTLQRLNRGHTLADFLDAARRVQQRGFTLCAHLILDLPWDTMEDVLNTARIVSGAEVDQVKLHSLYVVKGTVLARMYQTGQVQLLAMEDYVARAVAFLGHLAPRIVIQRIIGRAPAEDTLIANWHTSWWKVRDLIEDTMRERGIIQGSLRAEK